MKHRSNTNTVAVIFRTVCHSKLLASGILVTVIGAVAAALLPPLVLEAVINRMTAGRGVPFVFALAYFLLIALTGILESLRESLLTVFGQRITHRLRSELCQKLTYLPTDVFVKENHGEMTSRFVNDVDTVETLFTSGIISMFADACKMISILIMIFIKNRGLAILLLLLLPFLFAFTRAVQKRMQKAQIANRVAIGKVNHHVPETIRCIRTVRMLKKEQYMREKYDTYIQQSYAAMEKTNFYDAVYSPVILILNAVTIAVVLLLSATGNVHIQTFFGMSVGTAVAVVNYISQVFSPIESIGMEIQTIQSAIAGVRRIDAFLGQPERWKTMEPETFWKKREAFQSLESKPCIELQNVTFGYEREQKVIEHLNLKVWKGEQLTISGHTGAGKSTVFKLLLGMYRPWEGKVLIDGQDAALIPDVAKRKLFGYVEQSFHRVPGTVLDQITLFDAQVTPEQAVEAARMVGLHETICHLPNGYQTDCTAALFSQGQLQLLSIARAIAADPRILLLDEITANLDAETEQSVLMALRSASADRTVLSISHRLYEQMGGRQVVLDRLDAGGK
ncbi:MAG: ABC transporter ATP-binding protein [Fusicatenibacter sp.]|nr:ABC transporter ATP-binding protein/permease [Fusicatenibacter sp.]